MAGKSGTARWILIFLVAIGIIVVAMLPRGATEDVERPPEEAEAPITPTEAADQDVSSGKATKRVLENCDPKAEAAKYEALVDHKALAVLRWNNMAERAAKLKIPVYVKSVDDGKVNVSILAIPMREQYLTIWQNSGHISPASDGTYLLDPCASSIEVWEAMDEVTTGDAK